MDFIVSEDHRVTIKEKEKKDKSLDVARELKSYVTWIDGYTNYNWSTRNNLQGLWKGTGRVGNWRTDWDHPNYNIIEIGQNTEKSPGDLWRLDVTKSPVNNLQLTLVGKTHMK